MIYIFQIEYMDLNVGGKVFTCAFYSLWLLAVFFGDLLLKEYLCKTGVEGIKSLWEVGLSYYSRWLFSVICSMSLSLILLEVLTLFWCSGDQVNRWTFCQYWIRCIRIGSLKTPASHSHVWYIKQFKPKCVQHHWTNPTSFHFPRNPCVACMDHRHIKRDCP